MCLSNNRYNSAAVAFSSTIELAVELKNPDGVLEHICGYFNKIRTVNGGSESQRPNAMLLAIPAIPGSVNEHSLVPVSQFPTLLQDYADAVHNNCKFTVAESNCSWGA